MELREISLERYKGYAEPVDIELAPLTILVGANNSGKTALAQAIQLIAGSLVRPTKDTSELIPLESGGIRHGETFEDLVTGRAVHGRMRLSVALSSGNCELSLAATIGNVFSPARSPERQIADWRLRSGSDEIVLQRTGFEEKSPYTILDSGTEKGARPITWRGLIPREADSLADWVPVGVGALEDWATGVRHLQCPRRLLASPFTTAEHSSVDLGPEGQETPLALAADDALRESVGKWYRKVFGVSIDVVAQGGYSELVVRALGRDANIRLANAGRGLSHVLPVAVTALTAQKAGPGVDVVEHPEAELHPAAHADIAELLLANLAGRQRPLVIETHSEMVLLRARRWIAEGRLPTEHVLVYWINFEPGRGSLVRKIRIHENGELDYWPDGVFVEDYDEVLAIRRAARQKE